MSSITIAIADDHELIRKSLSNMLKSVGLEVLFEAPNGEALMNACKLRQPDIVLMDISMPVMDGIEATAWLKEHLPEVKVIALSITGEERSVIQMIKAGARAYFVKNVRLKELVSGIQEVHEKGFHFSELVNDALVSNVSNEKAISFEALNERERQFLELCCTDLTYKEIGNVMHVSPRTAEGYAKQLFVKLRVKTRVGLALYAVKQGLHEV